MLQRLIADEKTFAALIALAGVIVATMVNLYWNFRNAKALRKQPFLEKQLELCLEATTVAATLATTADAEAFECARSRFQELYWGPLSVVENVAVQEAMVVFEINLRELIRTHAPLPLTELDMLSRALALKVRELILEAWSIKSLGRLFERTDYTPDPPPSGAGAASLVVEHGSLSPK